MMTHFGMIGMCGIVDVQRMTAHIRLYRIEVVRRYLYFLGLFGRGIVNVKSAHMEL